MTDTSLRPDESPAYITSGPDAGKIDRAAALHRRRKLAMNALLSEFEREVVPHVEGHREEIDAFKRSCRSKLNSLTFLAVELLQLQDGEQVNDVAVDLAERLAFGDNDGGPG